MGRESLPLASHSQKARSGGLLLRFYLLGVLGYNLEAELCTGEVFTDLSHLETQGHTPKDRARPGGPVTGGVAGGCLQISPAPDLVRNCAQ